MRDVLSIIRYIWVLIVVQTMMNMQCRASQNLFGEKPILDKCIAGHPCAMTQFRYMKRYEKCCNSTEGINLDSADASRKEVVVLTALYPWVENGFVKRPCFVLSFLLRVKDAGNANWIEKEKEVIQGVINLEQGEIAVKEMNHTALNNEPLLCKVDTSFLRCGFEQGVVVVRFRQFKRECELRYAIEDGDWKL